MRPGWCKNLEVILFLNNTRFGAYPTSILQGMVIVSSTLFSFFLMSVYKFTWKSKLSILTAPKEGPKIYLKNV